MKRWAAALGSLAVVCFLTACNSSVAGISPASPGPFASQADQVVADLAAGNFTAVEAKLDPAMIKAARAVPLQKAWAACQDVLGAYRSHGAPAFARKGQFDLERGPVTSCKWLASGSNTLAGSQFSRSLAVASTLIVERASELPGRGQPHLAEHSLGQW